MNSFVIPHAQQRLLDCLAQLDPKKRYVVEIRDFHKARSLQQNARYWGHVLPHIAEQATDENGKKYPAAIWHEYFKQEFIGVEELPNGRVVGKSSTKLKVPEFMDFMTKVEAWAVDHHVRFYEDLREVVNG